MLQYQLEWTAEMFTILRNLQGHTKVWYITHSRPPCYSARQNSHVGRELIEINPPVFFHRVIVIDANLLVGVDWDNHRTNVGLRVCVWHVYSVYSVYMVCIWCVYDVYMVCVWCVYNNYVYDVCMVCMYMCVHTCVYDVCMVCAYMCVHTCVCMYA